MNYEPRFLVRSRPANRARFAQPARSNGERSRPRPEARGLFYGPRSEAEGPAERCRLRSQPERSERAAGVLLAAESEAQGTASNARSEDGCSSKMLSGETTGAPTVRGAAARGWRDKGVASTLAAFGEPLAWPAKDRLGDPAERTDKRRKERSRLFATDRSDG